MTSSTPTASNDLLLAWRAIRGRRAGDGAIFNGRGELLRTFADIEQEAERFEQGNLAGFEPGVVVAIQIGNHSSWPALLLACWRLGLVVLPLERLITETELRVALQICHAAGLVTANAEASLIVRRMDQTRIAWENHVPALLKLTSGTTATPRAIRFRSAQLLADCVQICDTMGITDRDLNFGVIPVSHSYGFSNLLTPLLVRGVPLVMSDDRMPRAVLDGLAGTGATVFPGMPVFYQAFCGLDEVPPLPRLRLCISAGAPLPLPVAQKFREKFRQPIHSFYGSSECGGICFDREARLVEEGFVGESMRGVLLELLDPGAAGSRIRVRSAAAGDGYFPLADEEKLGGGHFAPDDLLLRSENGYRIVGRVSDVINVAGKKVNPAEVEAALLAFRGVREAVVFGRGSALRNQEVAACIVAHPGVRETELLEFCRQRLSGWQVPKRIFSVAAIPVNERGKINRRALAERFGESPP